MGRDPDPLAGAEERPRALHREGRVHVPPADPPAHERLLEAVVVALRDLDA